MKGIAVVLTLVVVGCGGAGSNDLFSGEPNGSSGSSGTNQSVPPNGTGPTEPTPPCVPKTWYRDRDGDGFGAADGATVTCTQPDKDYVEKGGDCNDDNPDVFPGQTKFFAQSYKVPGSGNRMSFDYDCDGTEEQHTPARTRAGTCMVNLNGSGCVGAGYIPPSQRTGTGIDLLCGSVSFQDCKPSAGGPPGCVAEVKSVEAQTCQ